MPRKKKRVNAISRVNDESARHENREEARWKPKGTQNPVPPLFDFASLALYPPESDARPTSSVAPLQATNGHGDNDGWTQVGGKKKTDRPERNPRPAKKRGKKDGHYSKQSGTIIGGETPGNFVARVVEFCRSWRAGSSSEPEIGEFKKLPGLGAETWECKYTYTLGNSNSTKEFYLHYHPGVGSSTVDEPNSSNLHLKPIPRSGIRYVSESWDEAVSDKMPTLDQCRQKVNPRGN